jgi:chromosome segregation ATPase
LKRLEKVLNLKEREVERLGAELRFLKARHRQITLEVEGLKGRLEELKSLKVNSVSEFTTVRLALSELLKTLEEKEKEERELQKIVNEKEEEYSRARGELSLIKELIKRKRRKEEVIKEVADERFIYQVLYGTGRT